VAIADAILVSHTQHTAYPEVLRVECQSRPRVTFSIAFVCAVPVAC